MSKIFDAVKQNASTYDVISRFWEKPDQNNMVHCPFHEDSIASLGINLKTNRWKCFGCPKQGDAIDFVKELKQVSTMEAVKLIAEEFNIHAEDARPNRKKKRQ